MRDDLIKLANDFPEARKVIVPLIRQAAGIQAGSNVALGSLYEQVEQAFLMKAVQTLLHAAARGTPVEGKSGSVWSYRGKVLGSMVNAQARFIPNDHTDDSGTLNVEAFVWRRLIKIHIENGFGQKKVFKFKDHATPGEISSSQAATWARQCLLSTDQG